jgi:hypothetical protein
MKKELLSELSQMKYMFGYKPGKVISEQTKPVTPVPNKGPQASPYKLPGITKDNIQKFIDVNEQFMTSLGMFTDNSYTELRKQISSAAACKSPESQECKEAKTKYASAKARQDYFNEAYQLVMRTLLTRAANYGWTPEKIDGLSEDNLIKALEGTGLPFIEYTSSFDSGPKVKYGSYESQKNDVVRNVADLLRLVGGEENVKPKLKQALGIKMKELGIS